MDELTQKIALMDSWIETVKNDIMACQQALDLLSCSEQFSYERRGQQSLVNLQKKLMERLEISLTLLLNRKNQLIEEKARLVVSKEKIEA